MEVSRAKGNLLMIVPAVFNEKEMKIGDGGGGDDCGGETRPRYNLLIIVRVMFNEKVIRRL